MLTIDSDHFMYDSSTKTLSSEASTIEAVTSRPINHQFGVRSNKTGQVVRFDRTAVIRNGDEIAGWRYVGNANGNVLQLVIFND